MPSSRGSKAGSVKSADRRICELDNTDVTQSGLDISFEHLYAKVDEQSPPLRSGSTISSLSLGSPTWPLAQHAEDWAMVSPPGSAPALFATFSDGMSDGDR